MQGQYPALDIMASISRSMMDIVEPEHREASEFFKRTYAAYKDVEDMVNIGAYKKGSNREIDFAIDMMPRLNEYIRQDVESEVSFEESVSSLLRLFESN